MKRQLIFAFAFCVNFLSAQTAWDYDITDISHNIMIPGDAENANFSVGDLIGVFYQSGDQMVCAGYTEWTGANIAVSAFGTSFDFTGFTINQEMMLFHFDTENASSTQLYPIYNTLDFPNSNVFVENGLSGISYFLTDLIFGCTDNFACNYDSTATEEDGSCDYPQTHYNCQGECLNDIDLDGVCDELEISGCTDTSSCNYNSAATEEDGSCYYPQTHYDCQGICLNDVDSDGVCDELEIFGCTDASSCNYDSAATEEDGSCNYPQTHYNCQGICLNDVDSDGVCDELEIFGCTYESACNYDLTATEEDGSCNYPQTHYNCQAECLNDIDSDGVCDELEIFGCTDESACNYDSTATEEDGTCEYPQTHYNCQAECLNDIDSNGICDELEIFGCTDYSAVNYDPSATSDNNSCISQEQAIIDSLNNVINEIHSQLLDANSPLLIDLIDGWNMIGYTNKTAQDVVLGCQDINDIILLLKNNGGDVYFPEFDFNGVGELLPGQGYLLKVTESYQDFTFPNF